MRSRDDKTRLTGRHTPPSFFFVVLVTPPARSARCQLSLLFPLCVVLLGATDMLAQSSQTSARYRVSSTSVIALDKTPQPPLVDTVTTSLLLRIDVSAGIDTVATLVLDSLVLTSTGMVRRPADAFSQGISVSALLNNGRPRVTGDSASACLAERPMAGLLPELLPLLPMPLRAEQQWSDTLSVTTCRAGLPVTLYTIAVYRTLTGIDSTSLVLERRAVLRVAGSSLLRQQQVTLSGTGTSESLSVVSLGTRQIQSWRGTQALELQLTNGQQTRRLSQQLTDTATLVP